MSKLSTVGNARPFVAGAKKISAGRKRGGLKGGAAAWPLYAKGVTVERFHEWAKTETAEVVARAWPILRFKFPFLIPPIPMEIKLRLDVPDVPVERLAQSIASIGFKKWVADLLARPATHDRHKTQRNGSNWRGGDHNYGSSGIPDPFGSVYHVHLPGNRARAWL